MVDTRYCFTGYIFYKLSLIISFRLDDRHSKNFAKLFYGNIQSLQKCNNCSKKQMHYEKCFNFFLPYPGENLSMLDCLAELVIVII